MSEYPNRHRRYTTYGMTNSWIVPGDKFRFINRTQMKQRQLPIRSTTSLMWKQCKEEYCFYLV